MAESKSVLAEMFHTFEELWLKTVADMESWYPVRRKITIILLAAWIVLTSPVTLLVILLFSVYKLIVVGLAKMLRPDLSSPVPGPSNILSQDYGMSKSSKFNILTMLVLDGDITISQVRTAFQTRVLNKRMGNGEREYPELCQYWTNYLGYFFWKTEKNFSLQSHVRMYDYRNPQSLERVNEKELKGLIADVLSQPWKDGCSPWEILMLPNYFDSVIDRPQTVLMFRIHHGMGDGQSIMRLTFNDLAQVQPQIPSPSNGPKFTLSEKIFAISTLPFRLFYDMAEMAYESTENVWGKLELGDPHKNRQYHVCLTSQRYPVDMIKAIKNKHNVSFISVVCAAICGGIRRLLLEGNCEVPRRFSCGAAYPLPNHPKTRLLNHAFLLFTKWPFGLESREERLQNIFNSMHKSKFYTGVIISNVIIKVLDVLPNVLQWLITNNSRATIAASFFPGPEKPFQYLDCTPTDILFTVGLPAGKWGIFCTSLSLFGKQRFVINMDKKFFPSEVLFEKLDEYIAQEIFALHNSPEKFKSVKNKKID
ncbi:unnamed protein product [Allacma fusca]|uniref:O-acyltransferase WSD1 C-terminal domain-containing protein n=1 Tax=Allacma fusca TaxID=39272 RepID=A0A8J2P8X5_9HEXA|nr:unnamed protein product [Allacma fusca]